MSPGAPGVDCCGVEETSPMKRGLKLRRVRNHRIHAAVEETSPMKRGLKCHPS